MTGGPHTRRSGARVLLAAAAAVLAACSSTPGVVTEQAQRSPTADAPGPPTATDPAATTDPTTTTVPAATSPPQPTDVPATDPAPAVPPGTTDDTTDSMWRVGDAKPRRAYDDFLRTALADVQRWWTELYPQLYGAPFTPLRGGVYPAYPEREDPIPGCGGERETTYRQVAEITAFYCAAGDFIVYDDGEQGLLFELAERYGPSILGVVFAHEYGHAVQQRRGDLETRTATVYTEQQADCFAGAWVARAARGEAPGISFGDADVRNGLLAMIAVRDPAGTDQLSPGGHGSAFDRVGAFQLGFADGPASCTVLLDEPLPLMPNRLSPGELATGGNLPFGFGDGDIVPLLVDDLNAYWTATVAAEGGALDPLAVTPLADTSAGDCAAPVGDPDVGAVLCPASGEVLLDEPLARRRHAEFGDFAVGYMLGTAWAEAAQIALDSPLAGEDRALAGDCLVGAWVQTTVPGSPSSGGRTARISGGDLDEAIQTALVVGDEAAADDRIGSAFEKIAQFRVGVLQGLAACTPLLED